MIQLKNISKNAGFVLAIAGAAVVGGVSTALVTAAIPDSSGTIHACYNNKNGNLSVIDSDAGQACANKQTALNWNQNSGSNSGSAAVHSADGQFIGNLVDYPIGISGDFIVYNPTLNRVLALEPKPLIDGGTDYTKYVTDVDSQDIFFQSPDCTGQAYTEATTFTKTSIARWQLGGNAVYAMVGDNAAVTSVTAQSTLVSPTNPDQSSYCSTFSSPDTRSAYPLTTVSLPFSMPVEAPYNSNR